MACRVSGERWWAARSVGVRTAVAEAEAVVVVVVVEDGDAAGPHSSFPMAPHTPASLAACASRKAPKLPLLAASTGTSVWAFEEERAPRDTLPLPPGGTDGVVAEVA
jgi:hypothetical protein